jgi:rod shape-determining protein MreC
MDSKKKLFRSTLWMLAGGALILGLLWWQQPAGVIRPVQVVSQTVLKPFEQVASAGAYSVKSLFSFFTSVRSLKEENARLERERLHLTADNARLQTFEKENEELRKNAELLPRDRYSFLAAEIIARDGSGQNNSALINKGSEQGVREGMAAVVEAGVLIGKVTEVFPTSARVTFITSQGSIVNVETATDQIKGVAEGDHGISARLNMVQQGQLLHDGDVLVTSGLGGALPQGLLVGSIDTIRLSEDKLFQQAHIELPVEPSALHFLYLTR